MTCCRGTIIDVVKKESLLKVVDVDGGVDVVEHSRCSGRKSQVTQYACVKL
jgi:hypothetical protein